MRISALIPTFNRREYVQRAIESVLSQTVPVDELVVVDDGSTDGTAEVIQRRFRGHTRVVRQENQGVSGARRRAIREARSEWVAFLDSDDEWTRDRNRLLIEAARNLPPDVAWLFGDISLVGDQGESETIFQKFGLRVEHSPQIFEDSMVVLYPCLFAMLQGSLICRAALLEVDAFGAGLQHSEDFLASVQIASRYKFAAIQSVVGRLFRTSDLMATSLDLAGRDSLDQYRATMMALSLVAQSRRKGPWGELYAGAVRGLCKFLAEKGEDVRTISLKQFRYGISGRSIAFACAAMLGQPGIKIWKKLGKASRTVLGHEAENATLGTWG
jgi:hypothetical protein